MRSRNATALRDFDGGTQKTYQRMIEAMDAQIGRVLEVLDGVNGRLAVLEEADMLKHRVDEAAGSCPWTSSRYRRNTVFRASPASAVSCSITSSAFEPLVPIYAALRAYGAAGTK